MAETIAFEDWLSDPVAQAILRANAETAGFERERLAAQMSDSAASRSLQSSMQSRSLSQQNSQFKSQLAFDKTKWADQLALSKEGLEQEWERIAIERGQAEADRWYKQAQIGLGLLAHKAAMEEIGFKYWAQGLDHQARMTDAMWQHQDRLAQLGLGWVTQAVEYASTPENYWKLADFQAGASERQDVPIALQNLMAGVQGAAFQQPGGTPTPNNINDLVARLGFDPAQLAAGGAGAGAGLAGGVWPVPERPQINTGIDNGAVQELLAGNVLGSAGGGGFSSAEEAREWYRSLNDDDPLRNASKPASNKDMTLAQWNEFARSHNVNSSKTGGFTDILKNLGISDALMSGGTNNGLAGVGAGPGTAGAAALGAAATSGAGTASQPSGGSVASGAADPMAGWNPQDRAALGAIQEQMAKGFHTLSPGSLESLPSDVRKMILAGVARAGGSPTMALEQYFNSLPWQGSAGAA
jgi:hypothetical protein